MTDPNKTLVVALLDRTGSMATVRNDTCGAFDAFIEDQRKLDVDRCLVSLYQFDYNIPDEILQVVYEDRPIDEVPSLALDPRGLTPLNDALGMSIKRVGARLAAQPEAQRPGKVIFVVLTDGEENHSAEYTYPQVKELVAEHQRLWSWQFIFLGVGIDAFAVGGHYGFKRNQITQVDRTGEGVHTAYAAASASVTRSRTGK